MKTGTLIKVTVLLVLVYLLAGLPLSADYPENAWSADENTKLITLHIKGMTCPLCTPTVKAALMKLEGVVKVKVSMWKSKATIAYREEIVTVTQMIKAVEGAGFHASLVE